MSRPELHSANVHASAVALDGRGLLILGASGSGKSALALRLMALGAVLVADDRVILSRRGPDLMACAPAPLAGVIEARGIGLLRGAYLSEACIRLAVDLDAEPPTRMPQPREIQLLGVEIELILGKGVPSLEAGVVQMLRHGRAS